MNVRDIAKRAAELNRDESGEIPVGPILVIALVVIPIGLALMTFGTDLYDWFEQKWLKVKAK